MTYEKFLTFTEHHSEDEYTQFYYFILKNIVGNPDYETIKNDISFIIGDITVLDNSPSSISINGQRIYSDKHYGISICHPFEKFLQWQIKDPNYGWIISGTTAIKQIHNPEFKYNSIYLGTLPIKGRAVDTLMETFYKANEETLKQMKL